MATKAARALLLAVMLAGSAGLSLADGEASGSKEEKPPKIEFSPEAEKKFAKFLDKVKEAKEKLLKARIDKEVGDIQKATNLDPEGAAALKAAAQKPIDESITAWAPDFEQYFRKAFKNTPMDIASVLDQVILRADLYAGFQVGNHPALSPVDQPSWGETLKRTLNGEQQAAWNNVLVEKKRVDDGEIEKAMKTMTSTVLESRLSKTKSMSAAIAKSLNLPKDKAEALDALAKSAAEKSVEEWGKLTRETIRSSPAEQRAMFLNGNMSVSFESDQLEKQSVWKEGLAKILTPEELKKLQDEKSVRASRRLKAMGQILLAELDGRIAFTADQRERLQPIAEKLVKPTAQEREGEGENVGMIQLQTLLGLAGAAKQEDVASILDAAQWKHWKEICDPKNIEEITRQGQGQVWKSGQPTTPDEGKKGKEPEFVENEISDFMEEKSSKARRRNMEMMMLRAEDAGRVTGLPAENVGRLMTAARGAAEEVVESWKTSANSNLRSQIQGANAQNVRQRLASVQDYVFEMRVMNEAAQKHALWERAVKTEMTTEQQDRWKKAVDERAAFHERSVAVWIVSEFDRLTPITADQWSQLQPKVEKIAAEYGTEFGNFFSGGSGVRWYLQNYSMFIPFAGIPEKEFKAVLTKDQLDTWAASNQGSNAMSYWENVKQMHEQRVRQNR